MARKEQVTGTKFNMLKLSRLSRDGLILLSGNGCPVTGSLRTVGVPQALSGALWASP